jgi:ATP-dependent DNA helicase RecG
MPSALETLVKILKLEREQGCENRAVIGGLAAYGVNWKRQAHAQAKRPEHHALAEELSDILQDYDQIESQIERMRRIDYMMDRIVGKIAAPPDLLQRFQQAPKAKPAPTKSPPSKPAPAKPAAADREDEEEETADEKAFAGAMDRGKTPESYGHDYYQPANVTELDIPAMPRLARPPRKTRAMLSLKEAAERNQQLDKSVTTVKGIGQSNAEDLTQLGLQTVRQMLENLPRRYDDYTRMVPIARLEPDEIVTVVGTISRTEIRIGKNQRKDMVLVLDDGTGRIDITFFGQHFLIRSLRQGMQIVVSGKVSIWRDRLQMANPEWEQVDSDNLHTVGIVPVYRLTDGVKARGLRRMMKKAVDQFADVFPEILPQSVLERADLAEIGWTYRNLHFPEGNDHLNHARRRYVFDHLLALQLGILANRRDWQAVPSYALEVEDGWLDQFIDAVFPYTLTGAQKRAIQMIRQDVGRSVPMNRLLQGDVGAGKTAVALATMAMALYHRKQAAMMAPTSILAEQHYRGISRLLEQMPGDWKPVVALLTGSLTTSEREAIYRGMADGSIDLVIGTHALIQPGVEFKDLAIAIIDEQHRFGVEQRAALRGKGINPHLLVMTATPIPRTLALTLYADLDLSIIDEKPPGRQPVQTRILLPVARERAMGFIEAHLKEGRQAFVVHPLVEASDRIDARSAVEAYEELSKVFYRYRVCLLHGRMSAAEKDEIMAAFSRHEYDVMVTTSVAEVGVDIPNASVILIEGANRFGLSQLHQFRGRVGRGEHQSFCLLLSDNPSREAEERLRAMEKTDDGFELAEMDWKIRGAGELLGLRQSGGQSLPLPEFITPELVELAQQEARTIYEEDPFLQQEEHLLLAASVRNLLAQAGGDMS